MLVICTVGLFRSSFWNQKLHFMQQNRVVAPWIAHFGIKGPT